MLLALKMERSGHESRNVGSLKKAGKGQRMDSLLQPVEENAALLTP